MRKYKTTKSTLLQSAICLLLCFSMLVGTTFAWFTDQVTSSGNIIKSGSLDIDMQWAETYNGASTVWNDAAGEDAKPVFDYQNWEPGYTVVRYIKVSNEGNLAFKWLMSVIPVGMVGKLAEVIDVRYDIVTDNPYFVAPSAENKLGSLKNAGTLTTVINSEETVIQGVLLPEGKELPGFYSGELVVCITLHMQEDAGNEYQGENVGDSFNILLKATQYNYEYDSFDKDYDLESTYPHIVTDLQLNANVSGLVDENNRLTKEIVLTDPPTGISAVLPVGTLVDAGVTQLVLKIVEDDVDANVTLETRVGYDVEVQGVAYGNDKPIVIFMPKVLPAKQIGIQLYHSGKAMTRVYSVEALSQKEGNNDTYGDKYIYDANSGNVYFSLTHFSNVSLASTAMVKVLGEEKAITGNTYDLATATEITIPADGNVHLVMFTRDDYSTKNPLNQTIIHGWYNLNPGEMSTTPIKVEMGATVVLSGVNIRTAANVDALQIVPDEDGNKYGTRTNIYIADGTQNWLTGRSGIGFAGNWHQTDVYVEGYGNLYATAIGANCAAIGVSDQSDGDHHKMHFNVSHLRAIPMNNSAGIGAGGNSWRTLKLTEFNGSGLYQIYRGGNAASVGSGLNSDCVGEIIVNDTARVYCYPQPWTAYGRDMGAGTYAGICEGIYLAETADVSWYGKYLPSGREKDAEVVIKGYKTMDSIEATLSKGTYKVVAKFGNVEVELPEGQYKVEGDKVTSNAIYGYDEISQAYVARATSSTRVPAVEATVVEETPVAEFLYRVGNQNNVTKAQIATMLTGKTHDGSNVEIAKNIGTAEYNGSKFTGTGIVKVTIDDSKEYYLEVVDAMNITKIDSKDTLTKNVVLLNDMAYPSGHQRVDMTGNAVYGNGFKIDFRNFYHEADIVNAPIILMNSATFDNVRLIGKTFADGAYVYHEDAKKAGNLANYQSLIVAYGESKILNSFVSGTRAPVRINGGTLLIENSTISGGNVANIDVKGGTLNLKNVTTINQSTDPVGYGIFMDNDAGKDESGNLVPIEININGLNSYNWLTADDSSNMNDKGQNKPMPTLLNGVFADSKFAGVETINFRVVCLNENASVTVTGLGEPIVATISGKSGRLWAETGSLQEAPEYVSNAYSAIVPEFKWNISLNPDGEYDIPIEQGKAGSFTDVASALVATKYGVEFNITYEGETTYSEAGKYTIKYTVTDDLIYDKDGNKLAAKTYTKELVVNVTITVPSTPAPEFTINHWNGSSVDTYNKNNGLVVKQDPNNPKNYYVTAPTGTNMITIDGQAINAINVRGMSSITPGAATSFYFYYPIFYGINIVDGDNSYNTSTTSFPNDVLTMEYLRSGNPDLITSAKTTSKYEGWMTNKDTQYNYSWTYTNVTAKSYYRADATGTETTLDKLGVSMRSVSYGSSKTITSEDTHYYECVFTGKDGNYYIYYINYFRPYCASKSCVTGDTLVMLADGTQKRIDQVTYEDQLLVWDFYTGEYAVVPSAIIYYHGDDNYRVLNLHFDDGTTVKVINNHGFFDMEKNEFIFITEENVEEYLGDHFAKVDGKNRTAVKLVDYSITEEYTGCYSIETAIHKNFMVEGMFSLTIPIYEGWFDFFEIGDNMKYDEEKMQADIEKYGLYTYEDFAEYVTYEQFIAFNGPYLKVLVGRGVVTHEQILRLIEKVLHGN